MDFCVTHVCILGTKHCGKERRKAFKCQGSFKDVLCWRDYAECVLASFKNQIQYDYYGGNIYV